MCSCVFVYLHTRAHVCVCVSGGPENDVRVHCSCVFCASSIYRCNAQREAVFVQGRGGVFQVAANVSCFIVRVSRFVSGGHWSRKRKVPHKEPLLSKKKLSTLTLLSRPSNTATVSVYLQEEPCHGNVFYSETFHSGVRLVLSSS